jgi:hypothetical protein
MIPLHAHKLRSRLIDSYHGSQAECCVLRV